MKTRKDMQNLLNALKVDWTSTPIRSKSGESNREDLDQIGQWIDDLTVALQSGEVKVKDGELFKWIRGESDLLDIYLE